MRVWARGGSGLQSSTLLSEAGTMLDAMAGAGLLLAAHEGGDAALVKVYRNIGKEGVL
jgi:hypothetical protein